MVSILLPTFNRARFLPAAFESIRAQTHTDWDLVVVDDGSTDDTERLVADFAEGVPQRVHYIKQLNAGPYAARNTALDHTTGDCVAFFDSDDLWLPHHLARCAKALDTHAEVGWVYGACRIVDLASGETTAPDTFRVNGQLRPFAAIATDTGDGVHVLDSNAAVACALVNGLYCGLQNSVIRRSVFDGARFQAAYRNEAEDQLFAVRDLKRGCRLAFLDDIHVVYRVHAANSSGAASGRPTFERQIQLFAPVARGFEDLGRELTLTNDEKRALRRRLNREYFWHLGYAAYWSNGRRQEAFDMFRKGLRAWPWSLRCWKTFVLAGLRANAGRAFG